MAVYSIIQKSQLEGAKRLDAEYYQPEFLAAEKYALSTNHLLLKDVAFVTDGEHGSVDFLEDGIKYLTAENVQQGFLDLQDVRFVSKQVDERNKRASLKPSDVVLSIKGTVGQAAVVFEDDLPANMNRDVARIHVREKINPFFLAAFLNSKLGLGQTLRESSGNVQQMITLSRIRELIIPFPENSKQEIIAKIYLDARKASVLCKTLYASAENLLLEELGLKDFKAEEDLYSVVNFSDIKSVGRMDAEYFQPKYEKLISKLKAQKARPLADALENVPAKFNPITQPDKAFRYVELSNIDGSIGIIDGYTETSGREAPGRAKRVLKNGDVIVSTVEGSLGKVALVNKEQEGCLASTGFFQFRSNNLLPEVLLVIAKSFIFHNQLEQRCAGTILTAVPKDSIKDILVPVLSKPIQDKIAELVRESHAARKKAKELLEEAKRKVEELIESKAR